MAFARSRVQVCTLLQSNVINMDPITIIYALAVGVIAVVGLYKAYKNDNKISKDELTDIIDKVEELWNDRPPKQ